MRKKMMKIMRRISLGLILLIVLSACVTQPPQEIQSAVQTMDRYMPEYVTESNKALKNVEHPESERLTGNGERLVEAMTTLNRWASWAPEGKASENETSESEVPESEEKGR